MVSVQGASRYHADIVRLINGDSNPAGPGPKEEVITTAVNGEYAGRVQPICSGSHIIVNDRDGLLNLGAAISIHTFIMPTTPAMGAQAIIARWDPERRAGWALAVDEQRRSLWGLPADLHLIDWLEARGFAYDVITDEDLHREGAAVLRPYKVVLTGTHPEYYSAAMLDGMEDYLTAGGRLMYLGGNGFYWVTSYHPGKPHVIEVRKGESGSRAWQARPGEYFHSTTGERGGLWRNRARAPQKLVGAGFAAQGFDYSTYYRRMPDSHDRRTEFIFEGIPESEVIGDFGLSGGGTAGYEIDRYDLMLGTPPDALLLASSEEHSDNVQRVVEEVFFNYPGTGGTQDPGVLEYHGSALPDGA